MTVSGIIERARADGIAFTILGGSGFVGSHLAAYLADHGLRHSCPARDDESIFGRPLGRVIYCVGLTADYARRPFDTVEAHVGLLARVLQHGTFESLVYLSSTRLYDGGGPRGSENGALSLKPQNPRHLFDFSKGLGETLCLNAAKGARVARLSSVYAEDLSSSNFLHELIRAGASKTSTSFETSATMARDYIDVADVCQALLAIAVAGQRPIYNVASGRNVTNQQIFDEIERISGCRLTALRPPIVDTSPVIDASAIADDFGIVPRPVLERLSEILHRQRQGA
jgi:nucleoside-diphosphate-sugar epimerase